MKNPVNNNKTFFITKGWLKESLAIPNPNKVNIYTKRRRLEAIMEQAPLSNLLQACQKK